MSRRRVQRRVWLLAGVLVAYNNLLGLLEVDRWAAVPPNLTAAAALAAAARRHGLSWQQLGIDRRGTRTALRWGAGVAGVVAAVLGAALAHPATRRLVADARVAGWSTPEALADALVRIPLGTVLLEEVAFRGVLLGCWQRTASTARALVGSSVAFGLWHVVPTLRTAAVDVPGASTAAMLGLVTAGVVATGVGGVLFGLLRLHAGGLLAPVLAHTATNALGTLAAHVAHRLSGGS